MSFSSASSKSYRGKTKKEMELHKQFVAPPPDEHLLIIIFDEQTGETFEAKSNGRLEGNAYIQCQGKTYPIANCCYATDHNRKWVRKHLDMLKDAREEMRRVKQAHDSVRVQLRHGLEGWPIGYARGLNKWTR
jgi:hypothetical protein